MKVKTPIQELISEFVNHKGYDMKISEVIKKIEPYLEKERETIVKSHDSATVECEHYDSHEWKYKNGKDYFDKEF